MRILFIAHRMPYPPNKGEKIRAFWELCELSRRHEVDLFCFYDDPEDRTHSLHLSKYCREYYLERMSFIGGRLRAFVALLRGQPFSVAFFRSQRMMARINSALRSRNYDVVFAFSSSMAQYAMAAADTRRILDLVDVDSDKWSQYAQHSSWPWSWVWRREAQRLEAYESSLVRDFATTLVCTDAEASLLRSKASLGHIEVLENSLDVTHYDPALTQVPNEIRSLQPYVIFSGSMDYRPNVDAALFFYRDVFPLVRREVPEARLVIAGRNPHRSILALRSNVAVCVTGNVGDIRPYIWGASAAIVPMRIARGVQTKTLEALASGIPVVSTTAATSALPQALRSVVTVADTPEEMSSAVIQHLRNRGVRTSQDLRATLKNYIASLDLRSQLERLITPRKLEGDKLLSVDCQTQDYSVAAD